MAKIMPSEGARSDMPLPGLESKIAARVNIIAIGITSTNDNAAIVTATVSAVLCKEKDLIDFFMVICFLLFMVFTEVAEKRLIL